MVLNRNAKGVRHFQPEVVSTPGSRNEPTRNAGGVREIGVQSLPTSFGGVTAIYPLIPGVAATPGWKS